MGSFVTMYLEKKWRGTCNYMHITCDPSTFCWKPSWGRVYVPCKTTIFSIVKRQNFKIYRQLFKEASRPHELLKRLIDGSHVKKVLYSDIIDCFPCNYILLFTSFGYLFHNSIFTGHQKARCCPFSLPRS